MIGKLLRLVKTIQARSVRINRKSRELNPIKIQTRKIRDDKLKQ